MAEEKKKKKREDIQVVVVAGRVQFEPTLLRMCRTNLAGFRQFVVARIPGYVFHNQRIKRNNVLSDLLLEWKRISHPLLKTYSFVTASTSIPCGFIIQLSQAERSTLERLHCTVFFLKRSSSRVSVGHLLSDDLV